MNALTQKFEKSIKNKGRIAYSTQVLLPCRTLAALREQLSLNGIVTFSDDPLEPGFRRAYTFEMVVNHNGRIYLRSVERSGYFQMFQEAFEA